MAGTLLRGLGELGRVKDIDLYVMIQTCRADRLVSVDIVLTHTLDINLSQIFLQFTISFLVMPPQSTSTTLKLKTADGERTCLQ